ncbi:uncharacterized protein LOC123874648 [Maniola jurtina]|uniref:uncharacterized protein LOC123874648 n=1 Tax=Maniola jurtina TaxID=191418 RepID=UPI001E68E9FD|nr:uncharacterized protein LOC123874648 [Maniola jurtina]
MSNENETKEFDKAISRWKIQFDTTGDAVEFLERIEELAETLGVNKNKIIHVIPRCLTGKASLWYRNNNQGWKTWEDFTDNFKLFYYPRNYEKNLLETIINRRQQFRENFIQYLTDMQTLLRRYGKLTPEQQLERIYDNMKPNYQYYIKRKDFSTTAELIQLAGDYEKINTDRFRETTRKPMYQRKENTPNPTEKPTGTLKPEDHKTERKQIHANYDPQTCCWKCGKRNHTTRECKNQQVIFCSRCGLMGKLTRDCCKKTGEANYRRTSQAYTADTQNKGDNRVFIEVKIYGKRFRALVDTGSTNTYINKEIMDQIQDNIKGITEKQNTIKLADGSRTKTNKVININIEANGKKLTHQVIYLPATTVMIMGMDLLTRIGLSIGWKETTCEQISTEKPEKKPSSTNTLTAEQENQLQTFLNEEFEKSDKSPKGNTGVEHIRKLKHKELIKQNVIADELSRNPVYTTTTEEKEWYTKKLEITSKNPESDPDYCIKDGKLYKKVINPKYGGKLDPTTEWKLCVRTSEKENIIKQNHDEPDAGHLGTSKTFNKVAQRYYWPGIFRDVAKYVNKCEVCQKHKPSQEKKPGLMHIKNAEQPWEVVTTDLIGPLPRSSKGYQWIIVFHDKFTKWSEIKPLRTATANTVACALKECILNRYGGIKTLLSDNARIFTSKVFKDTLTKYKIEQKFTAPYTPQCNPTERVNRTLETMISAYIEKSHKKWDEYLGEFNLALNTSVHETTKYTPAFLLFGRELRNFRDSNQFPTPALRENQKLEEIYEIVRNNQNLASAQQKKYYDKSRRNWKPQINELVLKREYTLSNANKQFCAKLAPKYSGPHKIIEQKSPKKSSNGGGECDDESQTAYMPAGVEASRIFHDSNA